MKDKAVFVMVLFAVVILANVASASHSIDRNFANVNSFSQESFGQDTIRLREFWKITDDIDDEDRKVKIEHSIDIPRYAFINQNSADLNQRNYGLPVSSIGYSGYSGLGAYSGGDYGNRYLYYPRFSRTTYTPYGSYSRYNPIYRTDLSSRTDELALVGAFQTLNNGYRRGYGFRYGNNYYSPYNSRFSGSYYSGRGYPYSYGGSYRFY